MAFDERLRSCLKLITADPSGSIAGVGGHGGDAPTGIIAAMPADTGDAG